MTQAYWLSGLKLESDLLLPALAQWDGPGDAAADIAIRRGEVPPRLDRPDHVAPIFQTRGCNEYLLTLPGTGRILVRNGNEVTVDPETGADASATSAILTGTIQAVLWHQRGLLPLHASVVAIGGRAVALCGPSASGKSTLAAMLAAQGCAVIADDLCLVEAGESGAVCVLPGRTRLRLWRDALDRLGMTPSVLTPALTARDAFFFDCRRVVPRGRFVLGAVVTLFRRASGSIELERIRGARAVGTLVGAVHTRRAAGALGRAHEIFAAMTRLVSSGSTIWTLRFPNDPACLGEATAKVLTLLDG
jgi:hypothetical protein